MLKKLQLKLRGQYQEDKILTLLALALIVVSCIWALCSPGKHANENTEGLSELGTTIPKGFSIVPIELANAQGLSGLITKNAVVDVFLAKQNIPLLENLRILKLSAGEGPLFGALVPEKTLGQAQELLSHQGLRGVLKPSNSGPTRFHLQSKVTHPFQEISIQEDL
jgi:hypothetical protein